MAIQINITSSLLTAQAMAWEPLRVELNLALVLTLGMKGKCQKGTALHGPIIIRMEH